MSDTVDALPSTETQHTAVPDESSQPPPYSYQDQPPPYSAAIYPAAKIETTHTYQPTSGYESFCDINPELMADTSPLVASSSFDDKSVRMGFVRKVFSILTLQLLFTFSVVCVFTFSTVVKKAVQENLWVYLSSFIVFAVVAIALSCCKSFSRRHPWNIVALTRYDFTICYGVLLVLAVDVIMFGFFCTFYYSYIADVAYGCLGALLYSLFLMIDCQLMMGMMSYRLNPEEYINAALMIYLDIVLIFLYLLGRR
ncbi:protein lifeguard 1 [Scomber scombrus]|uniref:Protein lifeguard 1 n=1 Tax=Scomber scombrus TaxID=13677 RepID=A0AAV1PMR7_SCOSC